MDDLLATNQISFSKHLTSYSHDSSVMKDQLIKQLEAYVWDVEIAKNNPDRVKVKLTGKKSGGQDDLLVATLMIPYWRMFFHKSDNPRYIDFKSNYVKK
jgi:hypothetical protein